MKMIAEPRYKAGLTTENSGGKLEKWQRNIQNQCYATLMEEKLGPSPGSFKFKPRPMHPPTGFGLQPQ